MCLALRAVAPGCYDGIMRLALDPFRLLLISLAGWLNQQQQDVIDYLQGCCPSAARRVATARTPLPQVWKQYLQELLEESK